MCIYKMYFLSSLWTAQSFWYIYHITFEQTWFREIYEKFKIKPKLWIKRPFLTAGYFPEFIAYSIM